MLTKIASAMSRMTQEERRALREKERQAAHERGETSMARLPDEGLSTGPIIARGGRENSANSIRNCAAIISTSARAMAS